MKEQLNRKHSCLPEVPPDFARWISERPEVDFALPDFGFGEFQDWIAEFPEVDFALPDFGDDFVLPEVDLSLPEVEGMDLELPQFPEVDLSFPEVEAKAAEHGTERNKTNLVR